MSLSLSLRLLDSLSDLEAVAGLQRAIWPGSELAITPLHVLRAVSHNGGLLAAAFDGDEMIGFVFGFLGADNRGDTHRPALARLKLCSHQAGVLPAYRDQGVGYRLKLFQRDWAIEQGVRLVTWTYDPLESRNANLNIARLGCVAQTYERNVYGNMADDLNRGLPTDRFQVDWWVTSNRVRQRAEGVPLTARPALTARQMAAAGATTVNPATPRADGLLAPPEQPLWPEGTLALVEIPADFQRIRQGDVELALQWRLHTRAVFEALFAEGFLVTDFEREPGSDHGVYLLMLGDARLGG